jgi:hypothetical protein
MPKYVGASTIIEHKGLAKLKTFCANNKPFLICRDETITDVGIDGEIEICNQNINGKTEASGERIKFQLKTTESDNSYIHDEDDNQFIFYASKNDIEYWNKHNQDIILIIYDVRKDTLYGRKITNSDYRINNKKQKSIPVQFKKPECVLSETNYDFQKKYSAIIKGRLNYDLHEPATSNLIKLLKHPRILYTYTARYSKKENVYRSLPNPDYILPEFILYDKLLYTFVKLNIHDEYIKNKLIIPESMETINYYKITNDNVIRNHYSELLRIYFKKYFGNKGIYLNKEHNRFYFSLKVGEKVRIINTRTRKRDRVMTKEVAKYYTYGKYQFYKHLAFSLEFLHYDNIYLSITPTYLITSNGKIPVEGKMASKFIIPQINREYNQTVANQIHTIYSYLANYEGKIVIDNTDNVEIEISKYIELNLPFSISNDDKGFANYIKKEKQKQSDKIKIRLFNE